MYMSCDYNYMSCDYDYMSCDYIQTCICRLTSSSLELTPVKPKSNQSHTQEPKSTVKSGTDKKDIPIIVSSQHDEDRESPWDR